MAVPRLSEQLGDAHAASPLSQALQRIDGAIPGSFTYEDALVFTALLQAQAVRGDALEIGALNGKTSAVIALALRPGETLHVCDLFDQEVAGANDAYGRHPSLDEVRANILRAVPGAALEMHRADSARLRFEDGSLRFVHVDGDHRFDGALADLRNAWRWLAVGGLLAVDDHAHPRWPEVERAIEAFRQETTPREVIDFNRRGAKGRKIVFAKD